MKIVKGIVYAASVMALIILGVYMYKSHEDKDIDPPVLSVPQVPLEAAVDSTDAELLKGVTAADKVEGDLTDSIFVDKISKGEQKGSKIFEISYVVMDEQLNVAKATRELVYQDYHPPRFSIKAPLETSSNLELDLRDLVTASDVKDGDLTPFIKMTGEGIKSTGDELIPGEYQVTLEVVNSLGDRTQLPITVKVKAPLNEEGPTIQLSEYIVYLPIHTPFDPTNYLQAVEDGETMRVTNGAETALNEGEEIGGGQTIDASAITYSSNVDPAVPGIYQVVYQYTSPITNQKGQATLYVCVEGGE